MDKKEINFKTTVVATERIINFEELKDVIKLAHWEITATDETGINAVMYNTIVLGTPDPKDFTPYEELTEDIVAGWVERALEESIEDSGKSTLETIKENLEKQIFLKKYPETITEPLPKPPTVENDKI